MLMSFGVLRLPVGECAALKQHALHVSSRGSASALFRASVRIPAPDFIMVDTLRYGHKCNNEQQRRHKERTILS